MRNPLAIAVLMVLGAVGPPFIAWVIYIFHQGLRLERMEKDQWLKATGRRGATWDGPVVLGSPADIRRRRVEMGLSAEAEKK